MDQIQKLIQTTDQLYNSVIDAVIQQLLDQSDNGDLTINEDIIQQLKEQWKTKIKQSEIENNEREAQQQAKISNMAEQNNIKKLDKKNSISFDSIQQNVIQLDQKFNKNKNDQVQNQNIQKQPQTALFRAITPQYPAQNKAQEPEKKKILVKNEEEVTDIKPKLENMNKNSKKESEEFNQMKTDHLEFEKNVKLEDFGRRDSLNMDEMKQSSAKQEFDIEALYDVHVQQAEKDKQEEEDLKNEPQNLPQMNIGRIEIEETKDQGFNNFVKDGDLNQKRRASRDLNGDEFSTDTDEENDIKTNNVIIGVYDNIKRKKDKSKITIRDIIAKINGKEYIIGSLNGEFK